VAFAKLALGYTEKEFTLENIGVLEGLAEHFGAGQLSQVE
jgi:uncharacterized protein YjaZ